MNVENSQTVAVFKELAPRLRAPIVVFSDVVGNWEALEAVLNVAHSAKVQEIICLGDSLGHCANPIQCCKRVKEATTICLKGRLDKLLVDSMFSGASYLESLSERDARIMSWTEQQFCPGTRGGFSSRPWEIQAWKSVLEGVISRFKGRGGCDVLDWLQSLPEQYRSGASQFRHQVKSEGVGLTLLLTERVRALDELDSGVDVLFIGANHRQWLAQAKNGSTLADAVRSDVFLQDGMDVVFSASAKAREESSQAPFSIIELPLTTKSIISVGSVGQPRDGDPRAPFAIFDRDRVYLCRVAYDVDAAMAKAQGVSAFGEHGLARLSWGI